MSLLYHPSHASQRHQEHAGDRREHGPKGESWLGTALALAIAAVAIVAAFTLPPPSVVDPAKAEPTLPPVTAFATLPESAGLSSSKVDWSRVDPAPEPSPMAVAAYGD